MDSARRNSMRMKYISFAIGVAVVAMGSLLELCYKIATLLVPSLFLLFFMATFVRWATAFGTHVGTVCSVLVAVGVAYFEVFGLTFQWMMPVSFLSGATVGVLVSLLPIGRSKSPTAA